MVAWLYISIKTFGIFSVTPIPVTAESKV